MKKTILIYGILLAALIGLLQFLEYKYFIRDLSLEIYIGAIALFFTAIGIWVGWNFTKNKKLNPRNTPLKSKHENGQDLSFLLSEHSITARELDVLKLMEKGYSNQEIANQLFISLNTVKTHSSNLFSKLEVKRRMQAVQKAKEIGII